MKQHASLTRALIGAALIVGLSAALASATPGLISAALAQRLLGMLLGAVVVVYANAIPKAIAACARSRRSAAQEQAARRFAGWSMVLGGIGYMLAWLAAPLALANLLAGCILAAALLLAVLRYVWRGAGNGPAIDGKE